MHETLQKAVTHLLSPLVRLLLRHSVSHAEFCNWAKQVYVEEVTEHFGIAGKAPTVSRISILTGIHRKEVKRLRELPQQVDTGVAKHNRAVRVVTGWLQDADFQNSEGNPEKLVYGNAEDSFNRLVKRYSGDVPARAMLDELSRTGMVKQHYSQIVLMHKGFIPLQSDTALMDVYATSVRDLLNTLDHNLDPDNDQQRRFQMSLAYDEVTDEGREVFRQLTAEEAMNLLKRLDKSLSSFDKTANPSAQGEGKHRVGLGVYWIEDAPKGDRGR